jgi:multicomponent K+:H+ antiporter subunit E
MKPLLRRLLPAPRMSLVLALSWPVLNQSWSLGQLLLGALLALLVPWIFEPRPAPLPAQRPALRRATTAVRLAFIVLKDIVTSNFDVARLILGRESKIRPAFVWLPLSITSAHGIVVLAGVITMTPGTLSAELSEDRKHLLVHALNVDDQAALIETIKARYEAPLMEIFE